MISSFDRAFTLLGWTLVVFIVGGIAYNQIAVNLGWLPPENRLSISGKSDFNWSVLMNFGLVLISLTWKLLKVIWPYFLVFCAYYWIKGAIQSAVENGVKAALESYSAKENIKEAIKEALFEKGEDIS